MTKREDALDYHARGRPGKIAVVPTKPLNNQRDLSLAYSPGVAEPCLAIKDDPDLAYKYTARGNLVAVVTNGTAVLGLGNIGALAGKPVMEGKGNLFKQFADIDVFDLEVGSESPDDVIKFCQLLEPTVGGINLEDIKAPDCFYIEETLRKTLKIPYSTMTSMVPRSSPAPRCSTPSRSSASASTRSPSCSPAPGRRRSPRRSTTCDSGCGASESTCVTEKA